MQKIVVWMLGAVVLMFVAFGVAGTQSADAGKDMPNGGKCTFSSDCRSNNCSFKVCKAKSGSGGKQLGNGQKCTFSSDCESKNCSFKVCKKR